MATPTIPTKAVPMKIGTARGYRLIPKEVTRVNPEQFMRMVANRANSTVTAERFHADHFFTVLLEQVSKNKRVDTGFGIAYLHPTGSIESANSPIDKKHNPVTIEWQFPLDVRNAIRQFDVLNETVTVETWLFEIVESGHGESGVFYTPNATITANTKRGMIDPEADDEGIWLVNASNEIVATAMILESSGGHTDFKFPTLPPAGDYTLVYSCRNGEDPSVYTVATKTRKIKVVSEE